MELIQPINLSFLLQISNNVFSCEIVILGTCQKLRTVLEPFENKTSILHAEKGRNPLDSGALINGHVSMAIGKTEAAVYDFYKC